MWNSSCVEWPVIAPTWATAWYPRKAPESATALVLRDLTWLVLLVQAIWLLSAVFLSPRHTYPAWCAALVLLSAGTWLALLATQFRGGSRAQSWARYADVAAVAAAGVALGLCWVAGAIVSSEDVGSLAILTALLVGSLLPTRIAVPAILSLAVLSLPPVLWRTPGYAAGSEIADTALWAYVLAVGIGIAAVRGALVRQAAGRDVAMRDRDRRERNRLLVEGVESALRGEERLLHETVLNTLTAISRGGIGWSAQATQILHRRCREAVDVLSRLASGDRHPAASLGLAALGADIDILVAALRLDGVVVTVLADPMDDVPARVTAAVGTAVREALSNVARHAAAERVSVLVRVRRSGVLMVRAEVRDDGRGFDIRRAGARFGLSQAIADPLAEVGGTSRLISRPGAGTKIVLRWEDERSSPRRDRWRAPIVDFALPPVAAVGLFVAATVSLAWLQFDHPVLSPAEAALICALAVLVAMAATEAPLPWELIVIVCAVGPLLAILRLTAGPGTESMLGDGWALAAIAGLFVMAAALGPRWSWVPLLAAWLVIDWDLTSHVIQPATVAVVAAALLGRSLRSETLRMEESQRAQAKADVALEVRREGVDRLQVRYAALVESDAVGLLAGIADGRLDPDDHEVQRRSGLEETFIRNVMRNDPEADELRALVGRLAQIAYRRSLHLQTDIALPVSADVALPPGIAESLGEAVACSVPDGSARLAVRTEGAQVVLRLLTPIGEGERDMMLGLMVPGQLTDPGDPTDPVLMWEVRLPWTDRS